MLQATKVYWVLALHGWGLQRKSHNIAQRRYPCPLIPTRTQSSHVNREGDQFCGPPTCLPGLEASSRRCMKGRSSVRPSASPGLECQTASPLLVRAQLGSNDNVVVKNVGREHWSNAAKVGENRLRFGRPGPLFKGVCPCVVLRCFAHLQFKNSCCPRCGEWQCLLRGNA